MNDTAVQRKRRKLFPEMEGPMARWYAKQRGTASQLVAYERQAGELTAGLPAGADVLEVAPGPGYLAVELARRGFTVAALDISRTMVQITGENARQAGVRVDVRNGDAAAMPFGDGSFDLIVCQAAFKNFVDPLGALDEMHRVLRPGGTAVIQDMNRDAGADDVAREVADMRLSRLNAAMTRSTLTFLRRRAYARGTFAKVAGDSAFGGSDITTDGIGIEVRLTKPA
jgi:ubiquinone/menaquinone biosynthesis C-methylase UbiE